MKLFVKFLCLFIPLKSWRKKVRKFFIKDISFIPHIAFAQYCLNKKRTFDKKVRVIETVALGSSHCEFGFNPRYMTRPSFNCGLPSLDLYSCFMLYKSFCKNALRLKNIILFYSVFSNGYELEKTKEGGWACLYLEIIYGVKMRYAHDKFVCDGGGVKSYMKSQIADIVKKCLKPKNEKNYGYKSMASNKTIEDRVKGHLRENVRLPKQLNWLDSLHKECANNKHNLLIIIPPVRQDLRIAFSQASGNRDLFEDIKDSKFGNVYNFYDDRDFQSEDFADCDHLNDQGAKKLTLKINSLVEQII